MNDELDRMGAVLSRYLLKGAKENHENHNAYSVPADIRTGALQKSSKVHYRFIGL
jgi:hypothetical protein